MRILFIDDDPAFCEEMKFLLEENGFMVQTAADGDIAIERMKHHLFDLVVTDMLMNKSNGIEVILHTREFYPETRIIAITGGGWASPGLHLDSARMIGSDGVLAKPFPIRALVDEIHRVCH